MLGIPQLLPLIPAFPLAAAILTAVLGPRILRQRSHWPTIIALVLSCAASLLLLYQVGREAGQGSAAKNGYEKIVRIFTWADVPVDEPFTVEGVAHAKTSHPLHIEIALRADPLTAIMLSVVTFISSLVAIYSIAYMHGERGYWRFFSYISLFVFSMTMLVSASNFLLLYVFWEAVGLCSYLLIGFYYERPTAAAAGKKAFLVNRIGDFGFSIGIFLIWTTFGTLDFHDTGTRSGTVAFSAAQQTSPVNESQSPRKMGLSPSVAQKEQTPETAGVLGQTRLAHPEMITGVGEITITAICLLLMLGACGKSAQFPLHVWLPDAMEGPSPVSALIHAATMVTAGVYMVARCMPLFVASPLALHVVAIIGGLTALIGAIVAITQTDLKRILAYSTISHLGYMFLALGAGTVLGVTAGMFHLITHAFFKALLFLAAGSVMHAMGGVIDIRRFSGLRRIMPVTRATFLIGALSMAGFIGFSGFFSKDAILLAVAEKFSFDVADPVFQTLYATTFWGIFLIAIYAFRPYFLTFYGKEVVPEEAGHHAHESPPVMTAPLVVLAIGAALIGFGIEYNGTLEKFLAETPQVAYVGRVAASEPSPGSLASLHQSIALQSTVLVIVGILFTGLLYRFQTRRLVNGLTEAMKVVGAYQISAGKFFFDPLYNFFVVWPLELFATACAWFDNGFIDGAVNSIGRLPKWFGASLRPLQGGLIQFYALAMIFGILIFLGVLLL